MKSWILGVDLKTSEFFPLGWMVGETLSCRAEVWDSMGSRIPFSSLVFSSPSLLDSLLYFFLLPLRPLSQRIYLKPIHRTTTPPTKNPANFSTATRFPVWAIRPRRPALPLRVVEREENTSFCTGKLKTLLQVANKENGRHVHYYRLHPGSAHYHKCRSSRRAKMRFWRKAPRDGYCSV